MRSVGDVGRLELQAFSRNKQLIADGKRANWMAFTGSGGCMPLYSGNVKQRLLKRKKEKFRGRNWGFVATVCWPTTYCLEQSVWFEKLQ